MLGLGLGVDKIRPSGGFDADYQAVLDYATAQGYTLPSAGQQILQNQLVVDLKAAGVWNKLDAFSIFATDGDADFALIDWVRLITQTAVNSPTFTANQGYKGDGSSSYIDTDYNPSIDAVNYALNSASMGFYSNNSLTNSVQLGTNQGSRSYIFGLEANLNQSTRDLTSNTSALGLTHLNRSASTVKQVYKNGNIITTSSTSSTTLPNDSFYALTLNAGGVGSFFSTNELAMIFSGGELSSEAAGFNTAISTYLSAI